MGQHGGPRIPNEELKNLYDFSNVKSYVNGATTLYDLISNLIHVIVSGTQSGIGGTTSLNFSGSGTSTYSSNNIGLSGGYSRTLNCWVKFNSTANQAIVGSGANFFLTAAELVMQGGIYKLHSGSTQVSSSGFGISTLNRWYMLTSAYKSDVGLELYVNAAMGNTISAFPVTTDSPLRFGKSCDPANFGSLNGELSQVQFYTKRLPPEDIQLIYNSTRSRYGV